MSTTLTMTLIMAICLVPTTWPVFYFIYRNYVKPKKNIVLGVALPFEAHGDARTLAVSRSYKRWLDIVLLPMLLLVIPPFFFKGSGASMTWFMTWMVTLIVAPMVIFAVHRQRLLAVKRENSWYGEAAGKAVADVKAASIAARKVRGIWFLLPLIISVMPLAGAMRNPPGVDVLPVYLMNIAMIALFWPLYHLIFRMRSEVVNEDLTLTLALTRVRRYNWGKFWLIAAWLSAGWNLLLWLLHGSAAGFLATTLVYATLLVIAAVGIEFSVRMGQQKLTASDTGELFTDEDELWIWGLFYCNPNDAHFFVNDRVGMNMSINLAKPAAKGFIMFTLIVLMAMPLMGVWMIVDETTPSALAVEGGALIARQVGDRYEVSLGEIVSVDLVWELPRLTRVRGTGYENLYKGVFWVAGYGDSDFCLHPQNPPFLIVKTGERTYFLNDHDPAATQRTYRLIKP